MDDNNLKTEHGWYDSLKVIKAIEEHVREALRLSDAANLALSKELGDMLSSVIMSREAIESADQDSTVNEDSQINTDGESKQDDHFGEEQIDELKNLFAGLKDYPGDDRWS